MQKNLFLFLCLLFIPATILAGNDIAKETYTYSIKGGDTLKLDKYTDPTIGDVKPCIIFMFGGGFASGKRDSDQYVDYFKYWAKKGFVVVSIDYRLGMRELDISDPMRIVGALNNSISMAVEDLFDATSYVVNQAKNWSVDEAKIIANGSSAGAIAVLHGEYEICNSTKLSEKLPTGFNYAGVISFAGAIFSVDGELKWKSKPAPIQLFHGDADSNVPYDKIAMGKYGFYGSKYIATQLKELNAAGYFYDVKNAEHEISGKPMTSNLQEIDSFLDKLVLKKQPLFIKIEEEQIGKTEMRKDFELMDYVKANFVQ